MASPAAAAITESGISDAPTDGRGPRRARRARPAMRALPGAASLSPRLLAFFILSHMYVSLRPKSFRGWFPVARAFRSSYSRGPATREVLLLRRRRRRRTEPPGGGGPTPRCGAGVMVMSSPHPHVHRIARLGPRTAGPPHSPLRPPFATLRDDEVEIVTGNATVTRVVVNGKAGNPRQQNGPDDDEDENCYLPGTESIDSVFTNPFVELGICALVVLSSLLVAIGTLPDLPLVAIITDRIIQDVIGYVFALEFALRWYSTGQLTASYLARPLVVIDLFVVVLPLLLSKFAIPVTEAVAAASAAGGGTDGYLSLDLLNLVPPWLMSQSGLFNLRLLRILRLQRVLVDMETFSNFRAALGIEGGDDEGGDEGGGGGGGGVRPYKLRLARVVLSVFTLLSVSSGLVYTAEHEVNPQIPDFFTALYFCLTTLTTVGFGDITPVTFQGRFVVSASILAGITIIPAQAASLLEALLDRDKEKRDEEARKKKEKKEKKWGGGGGNDNDNGAPFVVDAKLEEEGNSWIAGAEDGGIDGNPGTAPATTTTMCRFCGAASHRPDANYCWYCGRDLTVGSV